MSNITKDFALAFHAASAIPFNVQWLDDTGNYDLAVSGPQAPVVRIGQMVKCVSANKRRIIIIGSPLGNVIISEMFPGGHRDLYVGNMDILLEKMLLLHPGYIDHQGMTLLLGDAMCSKNIGIRLADMEIVLCNMDHSRKNVVSE